MKLSIIVPSIRPQNLLVLYNSIDIENFEMIIVGPNPPPMIQENVHWVMSWKSPNACQQMGLLIAKCDYITFASDDGVFLPNALDKAIKLMEVSEVYSIYDETIGGILGDPPQRKETIVVGKYLEGDNPNPDMLKEDYYKFEYHKSYRLKGVPQDGLIFNCGIISRKFMLELGGWDADRFDTTTCAHADLGIRALKAGAKMILMNEPMFKCSHEPKRTGTHGPIHDSMIKHDLPNFIKTYSKPNNRVKIPINNWENTPEKWGRRFK